MVASGYEVKKGASMVFDFWKKKTEINTTQIVDEIEAAVYEQVKPYGFKKQAERFTVSFRKIFRKSFIFKAVCLRME